MIWRLVGGPKEEGEKKGLPQHTVDGTVLSPGSLG